MESFLQDLKFGTKLLWKDKGFTVTAILTLGLCIGANTTVFTVVDGRNRSPAPSIVGGALGLLLGHLGLAALSRMALGSGGQRVFRLVLNEGLLILGIGLGLASAVFFRNAPASQLYGVEPLETGVLPPSIFGSIEATTTLTQGGPSRSEDRPGKRLPAGG